MAKAKHTVEAAKEKVHDVVQPSTNRVRNFRLSQTNVFQSLASLTGMWVFSMWYVAASVPFLSRAMTSVKDQARNTGISGAMSKVSSTMSSIVQHIPLVGNAIVDDSRRFGQDVSNNYQQRRVRYDEAASKKEY